MWIDVEQNTDKWFQLRVGKATSSNFGKIMANYGKAFGEPAIKYARKVALEIVTNQRDERSGFKGQYMEDGNRLEPIAFDAYAKYIFDKEFLDVSNGGFNVVNTFGDSPDGNVGEKGCLEIKSVIANTQWIRLEKGGYDTAYKWQIHGHIWLGNKEWCDFASYCPEMPDNKKLYVYRVYRDDQIIEQLQYRLSEFWNLVEQKVQLL